jgi:lysozyme
MTEADFIRKYYNAAKLATLGSGITPELLLAQALVESWTGSGLSTLATNYNNFFGIKASAKYQGNKINLPTTEYINGQLTHINDYFRAYNSPADGFKDYVKLLVKHYPQLLQARNDPAAQAQLIGQSKYSTSPIYGQTVGKLVTTVTNTIKKYGLNVIFDSVAAALVTGIIYYGSKYLNK